MKPSNPQQKPAPKKAISPTREENYPEWYQAVVRAADLAENSDVRGCMVIKPWGYGIWEKIERDLDFRFKETGHKNAYFPLLIPLSFLQKEADHVAGFAKECAVVTHRRLIQGSDGKLVPASPLEEPFIIRPTSETIIGASFAKWVQSYRDLPILLNQWANVMRWEMRTRLFLRTAEFLWQEGHTCHETAEEAVAETKQMLQVYATFAEEVLAMPVIQGEKTAAERFPGAVNTYCIEAMMQDGKALQAGTSHFLGQNFSKAQGIKFLGREGKESFVWTTSWGVSTRLIGGVIMTHADDDGMVVPPRVAPTHVVILPIVRKEEDREKVMTAVNDLSKQIRAKRFFDERIDVEVDAKDTGGGDKFWGHFKKGVPLIVEVGPRDVDGGVVCVTRRDDLAGKRKSIPRAEFIDGVDGILSDIQKVLFERAKKRMESSIIQVNSEKEFNDVFTSDGEGGNAMSRGFVSAHCSDSPAAQEKLAAKKVTIRCIPLEGPSEKGKCIFTGVETSKRVILAQSY